MRAAHLAQHTSANCTIPRRHPRRLRTCLCEKREYYSPKDMPPLPAKVTRITLPSLNHVVVDNDSRSFRKASLAILYDIAMDGQYAKKLNAKSAFTALCMYDAEDVLYAEAHPGEYPNIDVLKQIVNGVGESEIVVEEETAGSS